MSAPEPFRVVVPASLESIEEIYAFLAERLSFPGYFGFNLDALYDCATSDICQPILLVWPRSWECGNPYLYLSAMKLLGVLMDAAEENPNLKIEFAPVPSPSKGEGTG
ncbi:Barstar [Bremerella volcania]|uniref:Barstar n=1 Tax=Bremerella volcania TaxID=2527984 RepID=A0A518C5G5_9BACT|nr:barstar family protein [Bremerella volcania]QDU74466.1 Barstar [Bremerella volcania]